jgi:protein gp37
MSDGTGIQWTDATWNPVVGCSIVSPGCTNCYAMAVAARMSLMQPSSHYVGTAKKVKGHAVWTGQLRSAPEHIWEAPLRWTRPRMIFVNSVSDLFHEDMPKQWLDRAFDIMEACPQHVFQILTKRSQIARDYLKNRWHDRAPPAHIWIGVSVEDQRRADERISDLAETLAAVRFLSMEPLLEAVSIRRWIGMLDWIIVGGESGPGARDFSLDWARLVLSETYDSSVNVFIKQLGSKPIGRNGVRITLQHHKGGDIDEWPHDIRIRNMPKKLAVFDRGVANEQPILL